MTEQQETVLLRRALLDAAALDFHDALAHPPGAAVSRRQERRMRAMLAHPDGYARRYRRPLWKKAARTAAMAALAVGLSAAMLLTVSPTARAAVKQWFLNIRHSDVVYYFTGETRDDGLPCYTITDLPEGYKATGDVVELTSLQRITYEDADGRPMYFTCVQMRQGAAHGVSTEGMEVHDITVNGHSGQFFRSLDPAYSNGLVWTDEDANLQFTLDSFADESVLLHIAESVSLVKTEK